MSLALLAVAGWSLLGGSTMPEAHAASAHRHTCHTKHDCPSDHHTYAWSAKRLWCTSYQDERRRRDTIRIRYGGRTYWCHRPPR